MEIERRRQRQVNTRTDSDRETNGHRGGQTGKQTEGNRQTEGIGQTEG